MTLSGENITVTLPTTCTSRRMPETTRSRYGIIVIGYRGSRFTLIEIDPCLLLVTALSAVAPHGSDPVSASNELGALSTLVSLFLHPYSLS